MEESQDLRLKILQQAKKLFGIFGFQKLTMLDIARAVGKGRSTIYLYFKNKEDIFDAIIEMEANEYINGLQIALAQFEAASTKFRTYILYKFDFRHAKAAEYLMLAQEMIRQPEIFNRIRLITEPLERKLLTDIILYGMQNREFENFPTWQIDTLIILINSSLNGISTDLIASQVQDLQSIREMLPDLLLKSIGSSGIYFRRDILNIE